ncbi:MAG: ABC transporter ATP-binding protein [Eubacteriales bacterium]
MKRYIKHIKPYWIFFVLSPLLMLVEVYCEVKIPSLAAEIINVGVASADVDQIMYITVQMFAHIILAIIGGVGAAYSANRAAVSFSCDLRAEVFRKIQEFSFANIDKYSTGSLITRLTNDITQLQEMVVMCLRMMFRAPGMLCGAIIMSYIISPSLSIVFVLLVPLLALVISITLALSYKKFGALQQKIDGLNTNVQEVLTNIRVIKAFTRENHENEKFKKVNSELKTAGLTAYKVTILQMPIMTLIINFGTISIMWLGSKALNNSLIEVGDISALITYLTQILMSVNMIAMIFLQGSRALVSGKRVLEILETEIDIVSDEDATVGKKVESGEIEFRNVDFRYYKNNEEKVLSNISFVIESGKTVGIIGSTGCGKTSLVNLIPRLYDATKGEVLVDGVNVKEYNLQNLREGVSVVLQNNMLFSGTIEENLKWGDKNATANEIEQVAEWSAAKEFIESKKIGYQAEVEQGGLNLSGGQKQRLCIARALLKKPKILILDDSTSAVDMTTEASISYHLNTELKDTTKLIIAQRISSVIEADRIIVMNDGTIESIGTHDELLATCITYQEIYHSQVQKEDLA